MAQWSIPLDKLAVAMNAEIATVVRLTAMELFTRVVMRSPVDTGRFRANWNLSYDEVDKSTSENTDAAGSATTGAIQAAIAKMPMGGTYWLANSLPYALTLENGLYPNPPKKLGGKTKGGYSKQAPHGMVKVTMREFQGEVRLALMKAKST